MDWLCGVIKKYTPHETLIGGFCGSVHYPVSTSYGIVWLALAVISLASILIASCVLLFSPDLLIHVARTYAVHAQQFFLMLATPAIMLLLFDVIFVQYIIPFFRSAIYSIEFDYTYITKSMIFDIDHAHSVETSSNAETISSPHFGAHEHYRFLLPKIFQDSEHNREIIELYLKQISSLIWKIRLMYNPIKEYTFLLLIILTLVIFFLVVYSVYYCELMPFLGQTLHFSFSLSLEKSKYVLVFLILWLVYVIFRLRMVTGAEFYFHNKNFLSHNYGNSAEFELSRVEIVYSDEMSGDNGSLLQKKYLLQTLRKDMLKLKENNQNVQWFVEFATAILTMLIAQFIV